MRDISPPSALAFDPAQYHAYLWPPQTLFLLKVYPSSLSQLSLHFVWPNHRDLLSVLFHQLPAISS